MARENHDHLKGIKELFERKREQWEKLQTESSEGGKNVAGNDDSSATPSGGGKGQSKPNREETTSELPEHTIYGFENEILSLKNFLLDQKVSEEFMTLAVVGKFGVGKTTLCKAIFNEEDVKKAYVPRLWVCMYKENKVEDGDPKIAIVKRILNNLGVEQDTLDDIKKKAEDEYGIRKETGEMDRETVKEKELSRLLYALHLNLWGKKYLIVLDDAWGTDGWNERLDENKSEDKKWGTHLSYGFPKGSGGRVIFTSRDEDLAKKLVSEEHNVHCLYPLPDPVSIWNIYMEAAKDENIEVNPRDENKYKNDVIKKSCGVPWAARILGKIPPVNEDEPIDSAEKKDSSHGEISEKDLEHTAKDKQTETEEKTGSFKQLKEPDTTKAEQEETPKNNP